MEVASFFSKPSILHSKHILLVIAHPDDEVMFFSPLLNIAAQKSSKVSILCISNGNYEGLGETRAKELIKSAAMHGIKYEDVHIINIPELQDGMHTNWPVDIVADIVVQTSRSIDPSPSILITFDEHGASYHPNHISTYFGEIKRYFI